VVFACSFLLYCVGALECYSGVCLFEKIGNFPNFGAMVCEGGPFLVLVILSFLMMGIGKLLLFAIVRIVCHSATSFSGKRGKDVIRLIR
jgi:hypothetical protein